jgi:hypothetical protein
VDKPLPDIPALLPSQQQLDFARQEFPGSRIALSKGLRVDAAPPAEQARWKNFSVVKNQKISGLEDLREILKHLVPEGPRFAVEHHHPRGVTGD